MAKLNVVRGRLSAHSEGMVKQKVASWDWWRITDEFGKDVMIKNVRALEFMRSHVILDEEGTFIFTNDGAPWFLAFKYGHDGHIADGWQEWKDRREGFFYALLFGPLLILPVVLAGHFDWGKTAILVSLLSAIVGLLSMAIGVFGSLGNLLSSKPSKAQVAAALGVEP